jgi:hypothetical protein
MHARRRQAVAVLCDAPSRPANRRACGRTPCALAARQPALGFGAWGACEDACGASWAARSAACANLDARLADLDECSTYDGDPPLLRMQVPASCIATHSLEPWASGGRQ